MPIPSKNKDEDKNAFMSRCMSDPTMKSEYKDSGQRTAICISKATEGLEYLEAGDFAHYFNTYGYTEEVTEANFYVPEDSEYEDWGEETEEWDWAAERPGLWENIRKKKEREGKKYKPAKKGDPDRPDPEAWKKAQSLWKKALSEYEEGQMQREQIMKMHHQLMELEEALEGIEFEDWTKDMISKAEIYIQNIYDFVEARKPEEAYAKFEYEDPKTGQVYQYNRKGIYKKDGRFLTYKGEAELHYAQSAEYQGRKVQLGKPFRTPDGPKKSSVYVKNDKGNVVKVNFGDPNMKIKKSDPGRRKNFRARHNCDNPGPRWKARYWSCRAW
jgi:hypothetical protein